MRDRLNHLFRKLYFKTLPAHKIDNADGYMAEDIALWLEKLFSRSRGYFVVDPTTDQLEEVSAATKKKLLETFRSYGKQTEEELALLSEGYAGTKVNADGTVSFPEAGEDARQRYQELCEEREKSLKEGLHLFADIYPHLWD